MSNNLKLVFDCVTHKYFQYKGRSSRKEFWLFTICYILLGSIPELGYFILKNDSYLLKLLITIYSFFTIFLIIPSFTVIVRRLHDINFNGWWNLFFLTPLSISISQDNIDKIFCYISIILFILFVILMCLKGTSTTNKYGEPPIN